MTITSPADCVDTTIEVFDCSPESTPLPVTCSDPVGCALPRIASEQGGGESRVVRTVEHGAIAVRADQVRLGSLRHPATLDHRHLVHGAARIGVVGQQQDVDAGVRIGALERDVSDGPQPRNAALSGVPALARHPPADELRECVHEAWLHLRPSKWLKTSGSVRRPGCCGGIAWTFPGERARGIRPRD